MKGEKCSEEERGEWREENAADDYMKRDKKKGREKENMKERENMLIGKRETYAGRMVQRKSLGREESQTQ